MEGKMNPRGRFVRSERGDGITWVGPQAAEGSPAQARASGPSKGGMAKGAAAMALVLLLQALILVVFQAKEKQRASVQEAGTGEVAEAAEPPLQEAPPAWSTPFSGPVFPGLEAIRRSGEAHVLRKPGALVAACRQRGCE